MGGDYSLVPVPVAPEKGEQSAKGSIRRDGNLNKIKGRTQEHSVHTGLVAGLICFAREFPQPARRW
jgi:hypothetical protein